MVMDEAGSSGTPIPTYQTPQHHNPEDSNLDQYLLLINPSLWTMMLRRPITEKTSIYLTAVKQQIL
jgi:hypothetical protein